MTREDVNRLALEEIDKCKCLVLELITGFGKTKLSINLINHICSKVSKPLSMLILVAKTVHKQTWREEINKWGGVKTDSIVIECYESLKKYRNAAFDIVICDEMQHLSDARLATLSTITINSALIGLSATIKRDLRDIFRYRFNAHFIKCGLKEAVESEVLPEPTVYLLPLALDDKAMIYPAKRFGKSVITTQKGYYYTMSSLIEWYKNKYFNSRGERIKNLWLSTAGKRLKWLSEQKESFILTLLDKLKHQKTLTFCSSIEQSERLGKFNITSKNKNSERNFNMFNEGIIKHITAVNILNEGE